MTANSPGRAGDTAPGAGYGVQKVSFVRNARVMLIGFALAQALPLLASPLLTRLFSPEAFGLQTLFVSSTSVLLAVATLRLDLATVLADDRPEAMNIVSLALVQALAVSLIIVAAAGVFGPVLAAAMGQPQRTGWVWAIAPMVLVLALVQISSGLMTWLKRFGPVSQAQVLNQASYLAVAIGLGLWGSPLEGLVVAKLVGQMVAAGALVFLLRGLIAEIRLPARSDWRRLWARCKPFLYFNTPYSLVGILGREVPIFAFSAVAATAAAGFYGLARTLLWAPATLLAASLSQVFYREAAEHRGTARLQRLTFGLLKVTMAATAPAFALIMVWGDIGFTLAFGDNWATAGRYAMVLAFPAWLAIQTAWPERLFESVGRQGVSFTIQITFDTISALAVFGAVLAGSSPWIVVILFAAINSIFHLTYLTGMVRVAGFPLSSLASALGTGLLVLGVSSVALAAFRFAALPVLTGFLGAAALAAIAASALAYRGYRSSYALVAE